MRPYKDWAPGPHDIKGKGIHHLDDPYMYNDWLVAPIVKTRDSSHLTESNWDHAIKLLETRDGADQDDDGYEDYEVLCFNHWAFGYFDIIVVRRGSGAHLIMNTIESRLEDYPILDEDDLCMREHDEHHDNIREACDAAINHAETEEDVRLDFGIARSDSFNLVLRSGFCPFELASHLNWNYGDLTPSDKVVYEALLEIGGLEVDYV